MAETEIQIIGPDAAQELAPLIAAYAQEIKRGAPRQPDQYYAELVLADRTAEILGARIDGELVAFAVFFDLPDMISGLRTGQMDDLFVNPRMRRKGVAGAIAKRLLEIGRERGWPRMRWMVPSANDLAATISQRQATRCEEGCFSIEID